jgi:hypothetical protein
VIEGPSVTQIVRDAVERACLAFTDAIAVRGFVRTKKMLWVRRGSLAADIVHLHRRGSSYGRPLNASVDFRIHLGIRVLMEESTPLALNGPFSDEGRFHAARYHMRFNAKTGDSFERCVADLARFVGDAENWFDRFRSTEALLRDADSPLNEAEKGVLQIADPGVVSLVSAKELGIKAV